MNSTLYEKDYYLWIEQTAQLLKTEKLAELDYKNLLEEIEDMGRNQRNALGEHSSLELSINTQAR